MKKRIVFEFDENSITELGEVDIESVITLPDGRVIVLPKLKGAIECAPNNASNRRGETFRSMKEIKDRYFPNTPLEELEGRKQEKILIILPRCSR